MFCSTSKLCELWLFCYHLSQWLLNNKCQSLFVQLGNCTFIWRLCCNREIVFHLLGVGITKRRTQWGFQSLVLQNQCLNWSTLTYLFFYFPVRREPWNCLPTLRWCSQDIGLMLCHRSGKLCHSQNQLERSSRQNQQWSIFPSVLICSDVNVWCRLFG